MAQCNLAQPYLSQPKQTQPNVTRLTLTKLNRMQSIYNHNPVEVLSVDPVIIEGTITQVQKNLVTKSLTSEHLSNSENSRKRFPIQDLKLSLEISKQVPCRTATGGFSRSVRPKILQVTCLFLLAAGRIHITLIFSNNMHSLFESAVYQSNGGTDTAAVL